jgi:hypothetical protein
MSLQIAGYPESPTAWSTQELGSALITLSTRLASLECQWMELLAEYDRREGWRVEGQLSAVDWLVWKCGLTRRGARDRLRVAHALRRRPIIAAAFATGSISYSKVREITRITDADDATDEFLLRLAERGTAADLGRAYHHWKDLQDQERGIERYLRRWDRRRFGFHRTLDGMGVIEIVLPAEEAEEVLAHLDVVRPVDSGTAVPLSTDRVDAFLDLLRAGRAHLGTPRDGSGADRYTVHLVAQVDALNDRFAGGALLDGAPLGRETLRRLSCDAGIVRHMMRGTGQPLDVGRRTSVWTAAQRRAVSLRDHGHCRFIGCWRRTCDVHHLVHYEDGGPTAVNNGCLLCPQHHTCVHELGFVITGDPNETLNFYRPDGELLGATSAG